MIYVNFIFYIGKYDSNSSFKAIMYLILSEVECSYFQSCRTAKVNKQLRGSSSFVLQFKFKIFSIVGMHWLWNIKSVYVDLNFLQLASFMLF